VRSTLGERIKYKYIVADASGGMHWEAGEDRTCDVPREWAEGADMVQRVCDTLGLGKPGAGVSGGEQHDHDDWESSVLPEVSGTATVSGRRRAATAVIIVTFYLV
jgi:hypothetical protein